MFDLNQLKNTDFRNRGKAFQKEYNKLVETYRCDWRAILKVDESGIIPTMTIIDATERLEQIKKEKKRWK